MIKVAVVGLVCVGGVGAIAAATSKSAPAPVPVTSITYPAVAGTKADRLSLVSIQDVQPTVEKVALASMPPSDPSAPPQPQSKQVAKSSATGFIPRHWHDPNDTRVSTKKPKAEPSRSTSRNGSAAKLAETHDCRADGVSSMLRKLSLQPACPR